MDPNTLNLDLDPEFLDQLGSNRVYVRDFFFVKNSFRGHKFSLQKFFFYNFKKIMAPEE